MNAQVLKEVAFQLEHGNPWWGIALLNRYLEKDCFFRKALVRRFVARIGEAQAQSDLAQALIAGEASEAIPAPQQSRIGSRVVRRAPVLCAPRLRHSNHQRLAARTRLSTSARFTGRELHRDATRTRSPIRELRVVGA